MSNSPQASEQANRTSLGKSLRLARELHRLSLRDVEAATGISNPYLSQLENDKIGKPSPHFLHKLAALYELDYEMVMESAGYVTRKRAAQSGPKTLAGAALFSLGKLTAEEEQSLAAYLKFLRSQHS